LVEEGDYLIRTCGDKDFSQRMEAESEQRASAAAMVFDSLNIFRGSNGWTTRGVEVNLSLGRPRTPAKWETVG
jgi:hypothetical protein